MSGDTRGLTLDTIIFIGRTYEEYVRMFRMTEEEIGAYRILDVPAGACSFTAVADRNGGRVTAADIAYQAPVTALRRKGLDDIDAAVAGVDGVKEHFVWTYFKDASDLERHRRRALSDCLDHMERSPERYVPCVLPNLPFDDKQFDFTLSAHFLFTYADRLDFDFHVRTVRELMRVTHREIRLFPLVDLSGAAYVHMDRLLSFVHEQGWKTETVPVDYEFQRGANAMLRLYQEL